MEKFRNIDQDIENVTNKEVVKQTQISGIAVGLIIISVLLGILGKTFEDPNSVMPSFLFTASALIFLGGLIKLFIHRSCYIFRPTKSRLKKVTLFYSSHESETLQACIESKRFDELKHLKREKDNGVKVEAIIADDQEFVAAQVYEYIPYTYEAVMPVRCYYGEDAKKFIDNLK